MISDMLSVSIVLYQTPVYQLRRCLNSISKFRGQCHIYFIDNSPLDSLRTECKTEFSHYYIHLPENPGFGSGHNVAIRDAQTKIRSCYHLVINADVSFHYDIITPMLKYMQNHPEVGQMMPKVLNPDGSVQYLCKLVPSPVDLFLRRFTPSSFKNSGKRHFELHDSGYDKVMFVPYLSGCFMLLRQSALQEIGLFDERFFMYPEDIDLTRRMAERYETIYFPEVSVVHEHGAASYKSVRMLIVHVYNLVKYFNKWGWINDPIRERLNQRTLKNLL